MRSKREAPQNYVLIESYDDFRTAFTKILRASTNKKLVFSHGRELGRKNKPFFKYFISVYDNTTGGIIDRFRFEQQERAFISTGEID